MKNEFSLDLTVVIPIRIDSKERMRNLRYVVNYLERLKCKIIVLEADSEQKVLEKDLKNDYLEYHFVTDQNKCFHRTHYINQLLKMTNTKVVAIWDADLVIPEKQVIEAYSNIIENRCMMAYPYNGDFVFMSSNVTNRFLERDNCDYYADMKFEYVEHNFCGGVFFVNRERYLKYGGENERFVGWGPEDVERLKRISILGEVVRWTTSGRAYHLFHPRNRSSNFFNRKIKCKAEAELINICSMDKSELQDYIKTW